MGPGELCGQPLGAAGIFKNLFYFISISYDPLSRAIVYRCMILGAVGRMLGPILTARFSPLEKMSIVSHVCINGE